VHSHLDFEGIQLKSLRSFDRKYITANEGNKRGYAPLELYDLAADPGEQHNLAGEQPEAVALYENSLNEMDAFIQKGAAQPTSLSTENLSPAELERLRSLGYLNDKSGGN
jgi:hypothetical protein